MIQTQKEVKKEMFAKYPGMCFVCEQKIEQNEAIYYFPERTKKVCHRTCPERSVVRVLEGKESIPPVVEQKATVKAIVPDGYYTVVFEFGGEEIARTLRIHTQKKGQWAEGKQIISLLTGSNNEADYTDFGFVHGRFLSVWKSKALMQAAIAAANILLENDYYKDAGKAYVLKSGRCCRCNRLLTVASSIEAMMGPKCAGKMGL